MVSPITYTPTLWLRPSIGLFVDDAGATPVSATGDLVGRWADQSGNANHLIQATSGSKPSYIIQDGGIGVVKFATKSLTAASFWGSGYNTALTVFLVTEHSPLTTQVALGANTNKLFFAREAGSGACKIDHFTNDLTTPTTTRYLNIDNSCLGIEVLKYDGTTKKMRYYDGAGSKFSVDYAVTGNLGLTGTLTLGNFSSGGFPHNGFIRSVIIYQASLTDLQEANVVGYLIDECLGSPPAGAHSVGAGDVVVVCDGDSLTSGAGTGTPYPTQLDTLLGAGYSVTNFGVSSQRTFAMSLDSETQVDALFNATAAKNICVVWEGTNDIYFGLPVGQSFAQTKDYCLRRKSKGFQVLIGTVLPRTSVGQPADQEGKRQIYNALIRSHWEEFADGLCDFAADSRLGDDGDQNDTTYFNADATHMNTTGYGVIAELVEAAILALPDDAAPSGGGSRLVGGALAG